MVDGIKYRHQVDEEYEALEAVFFAELEGGFEGEDGVGTGFILKTVTLSLESIIAHTRIHAWTMMAARILYVQLRT